MRTCPDCERQIVQVGLRGADADLYRNTCPGRRVHQEQAREDAACADCDGLPYPQLDERAAWAGVEW